MPVESFESLTFSYPQCLNIHSPFDTNRCRRRCGGHTSALNSILLLIAPPCWFGAPKFRRAEPAILNFPGSVFPMSANISKNSLSHPIRQSIEGLPGNCKRAAPVWLPLKIATHVRTYSLKRTTRHFPQRKLDLSVRLFTWSRTRL
jgi:hypothetical protein